MFFFIGFLYGVRVFEEEEEFSFFIVSFWLYFFCFFRVKVCLGLVRRKGRDFILFFNGRAVGYVIGE